MKSRPRSGFSLVELLIASVIIALTGSLLVGGLTAANRGAARRTEQAQAAQEAASALALVPDHLAAGLPETGPCPEQPSNEACTMTLSDAALPSLKQVTLTITRHGQATRITTLRPIQDAQP